MVLLPRYIQVSQGTTAKKSEYRLERLHGSSSTATQSCPQSFKMYYRKACMDNIHCSARRVLVTELMRAHKHAFANAPITLLPSLRIPRASIAFHRREWRTATCRSCTRNSARCHFLNDLDTVTIETNYSVFRFTSSAEFLRYEIPGIYWKIGSKYLNNRTKFASRMSNDYIVHYFLRL